MRWLGLTLILAASLCNAASRCHDPKLRKATIRGDTISGTVEVYKKPLKFAKVQLTRSSGRTAWDGATDEHGRFVSIKMLPDNYRLKVAGWGVTTVQVNPNLDKTLNGRNPFWGLILTDNACVVTLMEFR